MKQSLAHIAVVVRDYDEAIAYYTSTLGFTLIEDTVLSETKRWVMVQPTGANNGCMLLLAKACLLYTSPSPRDRTRSRMPSSA